MTYSAARAASPRDSAKRAFMSLAGNDLDPFAAETFSATHSEAELLPGPIENISARGLLKATDIKKGELDCLIGGPPCQAFSVYNHQRGMHDKRSGLFQRVPAYRRRVNA